MSRLLRSSVVLRRTAAQVYGDEEGHWVLWLDPDVYEDMLQPERITVTVELGDRLNGAS